MVSFNLQVRYSFNNKQHIPLQTWLEGIRRQLLVADQPTTRAEEIAAHLLKVRPQLLQQGLRGKMVFVFMIKEV